jgi:arylsulfatase A-like enzyme
MIMDGSAGKTLLLLFCTAAIVHLSGCQTETRPTNVLIIAVDTLRPDHLGCYGYDRHTSPNVDELARSGVLFENAISQAPWTLPSFASVFTSLYPTQHGATGAETMMRAEFPTLASILNDHGYKTGAVVNAPVLRSDYGLNRGFQFYSEPSTRIERPADEVTRDALDYLDGLDHKPFLAFIHYFDPHFPYAPPRPYDNLYDPDYQGALGSSFNLDYFTSKSASTVREEIKAFDKADRSHIISLYDGEIAFTDSAIGVLLDGLAERRLDQNTLVVFLSDHGEEFFDHGGLDHGHSLYGELIHVPLIRRFPDATGKAMRLAQHVRLVDVTPTILDYLGIEANCDFEGISLLRLFEGTDDLVAEPGQFMSPGICFSEAMRRTNTVKSITAYPYKLIEDIASGERSLFDLDSDAREQRNVAAAEHGPAAGLERLVLNAVFGMSSTWFVEMGTGGEHHVFDMRIVPERGLAGVGIPAFRLLDPEGNAIDAAGLAGVATGEGLTLKGLDISERLTLAFQVEHEDFPVTFDLSIDGIRSRDRVFLGDSLSTPETLPFSQKPNRRVVRASRRPGAAPDPPYFHIWHSSSRYVSRARAQLSPRTRRELRSLGYIQ